MEAVAEPSPHKEERKGGLYTFSVGVISNLCPCGRKSKYQIESLVIHICYYLHSNQIYITSI